MHNIQDLFNELQRNVLEEEYNEVMRGHDEFVILEQEIYKNSLAETLIYNNPEKKRLDVLLEEAAVQKERDLIQKLTDQMKKVLHWIMNIFNHQKQMFQQGADFVNTHDLNKYMQAARRKSDIPVIQYHPNKTQLPNIQTKINGYINVLTNAVNAHGFKKQPEQYDYLNKEGDKEAAVLDKLKVEFKLDNKSASEIKITQVNILNVQNNLLNLPKVNKDIDKMKSKAEKLYKKAINDIRNKANGEVARVGPVHINGKTTEKKANRANSELNMVNGFIKRMNEYIRAYSKILTFIFKEEYKVAKGIVDVANGKTLSDEEPVEQQEQKKEKGKVLKFGKKR
jgi:hypothetical protein